MSTYRSEREQQQQDRSRSRRTDGSPRHHLHRHDHRQPRYLEPDSSEYENRPRRHKNDGYDNLKRIHSRPEDYKGKQPNGNWVEYICFDGTDGPQENNDENHHGEDYRETNHATREEQIPLDRHDSNSSEGAVTTDDSGYDSEDELTLPSTYHHDIAHRGHEHDDWPSYKHQQARKDSGYESSEDCSRKPKSHKYDPRGQHDEHAHPYGPDHQHCEGDNSERRSSSTHKHDHDSAFSHSDPDPGYHSSSPPKNADLIKMVAEHLQSHKDAYRHGDKGKRVNELLGEVVRKVADGGLNENMIKDIVREVQHVL